MIDGWKAVALAWLLAGTAVPMPSALAQSPSASAAPAAPYVVEYYYKTKWGHQGEFIDLFKKNHYPVLRRLKELGYIRDIAVAYPVNHAGESDRWDMRVTVTFRDYQASLPDPAVDASIMPELYPDKEAFEREEQRRFELLLEHTDVPLFIEDMAEWDAPPDAS